MTTATILTLAAIADTTDIEALRAAREDADGEIADAIDFRLHVLDADDGPVAKSIAEDKLDSMNAKMRDNFVAHVGGADIHPATFAALVRRDVIDDDGALTAAGVAVAGLLGVDVTVAEPVDEAPPVPADEALVAADVEVVDTDTDTDTDNTDELTDAQVVAKAFAAGLSTGSVELVQVLIAEIRREDCDDAALAAAIVEAHTAFKPAGATRRTSTTRAPRSTSTKVRDRMKATICAADDNGFVDMETMTELGWTKAYTSYASSWSPSKSGTRAAAEFGYTVSFSTEGVTFTETATEE